MKLIISGGTGRMGSIIREKAEAGVQGASVAAIVGIGGSAVGGYEKLADFTGEADCVIDFSNHVITKEVMAYCVERKLPVLVATTGQTEEELECIRRASESIPVFLSGNMSVGIAVTADLVRRAAAAFPDADIEIVEIHHNRKLDVPSGTALMLANAAKEARPEARFVVGRHENGKRAKEEIGIHSLRYGNETGTHEVIISTDNETITIKHESQNRALFADGALVAAAFLIRQAPGLYNMKDMMA